ncbi:MAG: Ribosomal RNA small subunit methyltransferase D, partial [Chlamydiae bacterium]|nr:Ribosomal RNA small subunit methyltransferase D [Chlamydiota bacterium]
MKILAGKYKNRPLKTPKGDRTRPTASKVRESIFSILQNQIEGARFLDLFAGSGSMGLEALSRGAESAVFIEKNRLA